jgi:hypothetical protein
MEPSVGGVRPDFLIEAQDGRTLVLEAKSWARSRQTIERAQAQAQFFRSATDATDAWIVLQDTPSDTSRGVASLADLTMLIDKWRGLARLREPPGRRQNPYLFAAMPFEAKYDDVHLVAMVGACNGVGLDCLRVDYEQYTGQVIDHIHQLIRDSVGMICDLSESNPNVTYEAGYAMALKLKVVAICSTELADVPFNLRGWNILSYRSGQTLLLRRALKTRLKSVFGTGSK